MIGQKYEHFATKNLTKSNQRQETHSLRSFCIEYFLYLREDHAKNTKMRLVPKIDDHVYHKPKKHTSRLKKRKE